MNHLFQTTAIEELLSRVDHLQPTAERLWGKMDVAQMMAHCSTTLEMASGKFVAKRSLIGRIIGPRLRHLLVNDKPFPRNSPTAKELKTAEHCEFAQEKERLKKRIREFHEGGEAQCTKHPHPFFGPITPLEWSSGMYKHLDHHLKQFGA